MKERIIKLMELLNMSPTQFANAIDIQRATLQHIISGRNEPSLKIIMAIHNKFPDVELEWLLNGKGTAIPAMQQNSDPNPDHDYPMLPGFESPIFPDRATKESEFSNLSGQNEPIKQRKKHIDKEMNLKSDVKDVAVDKKIKEVVIFFEDGTYQKFYQN